MQLDQIHHGDCIEGMKKLPDGGVDLVFADPPFNIGYAYDEYHDKRDAGDYLGWSRDWVKEAKRVLKPNGTFWLAIGDEYAAELKVLCTRELGFHCRSWVVWFYTFGVHCKNKFTRSHTHLFHFVKNSKEFTFNSLDVRVPSAREIVYGDKRADPNGRVPDDTVMMAPVLPPDVPTYDGFVLRPQDIPERFPPHSDTWYYSRVAGTFKERGGWHGCQMPEQLLGRIIRACSNQGDLVLDPFAGSGTTPSVAKKLERRFIGFELSEKYASMINKRLAAIQPRDPLEGPENAAKSAPRTRAGRRLVRPETRAVAKTSQSPIIARANVSLGQVAIGNGELTTAIKNAFKAGHQGYSADRVLADPALNDKFLDSCRLLGVPGDAKAWNHLLLNVRKRGGLAAIETTRKTLLRRSQMEPFLFASEIAWQRISEEQDCSLDDILCDSELALQFEKLASRIAPGHSSFHYRWAALSIRKDAAKGERLLDRVDETLSKSAVPMLELERLPVSPGHYFITAAETHFFVGYTDSLRSCPFFSPDRLGAALEAMSVTVRNEGEVKIRTRSFDRAALRDTDEKVPPVQWKAARRAKLLLCLHPVANVPYSLPASHPLSAA